MNRLRTDLENRIHNYAHNAGMVEDEVGFIFDCAKFGRDEAYRNTVVQNLHDQDLLDLFEALVQYEHFQGCNTQLNGVGV